MRFLIGFIGTLTISAGIAWLSGYDFDTRNATVAVWAFASVMLGIVAGVYAAAQS